MKKAVGHLSWAMSNSSSSVAVQKKVIKACTQLYAYILKWVVQKKTDNEVKESWNLFCLLKNRIMQECNSDNEG